MSNTQAKAIPPKLSKKIATPQALPKKSRASFVAKTPLKIFLKTSPNRQVTNQPILVLSSHFIKKDDLLESYEQTHSSLHSHLILLPSISHKLDYNNSFTNQAQSNDETVFNYNNSLCLETKLDNNWQSLVNWLMAQARKDGQFFRKLGNFLTRSRLGIFRSYHIKREFNLREQLKSINNLWTLYNQSRQNAGSRTGLAQKLQKLYKEGYLSTLQKLSILKFFSDFREDIVNQHQKSKPEPKVQRIGLRAKLGFKPKIKLRPKTELSAAGNLDPKSLAKQFDKRWNKFIDNWFKNPINTHTQFEASASHFLEQIYKQLMSQNNTLESNVPKLTTVEICLEFLRVNKELINNRFEFAAHLNDLYYNLPQNNYIFRQELLSLWQALFFAYQDKVSAAPESTPTNLINSLVKAQQDTVKGDVERTSVQVW